MSSPDSWPKWQPPQPVLQDMETETARVLYKCSNVASHGPQDVNLSVCGINKKKYSSLRKLLIVTCYCLKFVKKRLWDLLSESRRMLIGKRYALLAEVFGSLSDGQFICATDIKLAMLLWIYCVHQNRFCDVLSAIKEDKSHCLKRPSFRLPCMPPWPKERVSRSDHFQFVGLDYLGPVNVKCESQLKKTWICLFICLSIRAIHLEWVLDLSASQFLNCLRRFVSHRGKPDVIFSDNASQFKLVCTVVDREWRKVLKDKEVMNYVSAEGIKWKYMIALAPWQCGFYERLIGLVKRCMRKSISRKYLSLEQHAAL